MSFNVGLGVIKHICSCPLNKRFCGEMTNKTSIKRLITKQLPLIKTYTGM